MSCQPPFNRQYVERLEDDVAILTALLSSPTGIWVPEDDGLDVEEVKEPDGPA